MHGCSGGHGPCERCARIAATGRDAVSLCVRYILYRDTMNAYIGYRRVLLYSNIMSALRSPHAEIKSLALTCL